MTILKVLGMSAVSTSAAGVAFLAYAFAIGGPHLAAVAEGDRWHIEGRVLGEYSLGFERVRIADVDSGAVICDLSGQLQSDLNLARGINTAASMFGRDAVARFHRGSDACQLMWGRDYLVTAWGNNGWGNIRPSSIQIRF